jgi:hypothetical protein
VELLLALRDATSVSAGSLAVLRQTFAARGSMLQMCRHACCPALIAVQAFGFIPLATPCVVESTNRVVLLLQKSQS